MFLFFVRRASLSWPRTRHYLAFSEWDKLILKLRHEIELHNLSKTWLWSSWGILQKLGHLKFCVWVFCLEMVKHPQTYPLIPKIPLGWSIKSKFWRIFKCTFMHVKYVVQRFVPRDLIFWSFAYCLTISESSCQPGSTGTQIWAQNSMIN